MSEKKVVQIKGALSTRYPTHGSEMLISQSERKKLRQEKSLCSEGSQSHSEGEKQRMKREYYSDSIANFRNTTSDEVLGGLARSNDFPLEQTQRDAWLEEIILLQDVLSRFQGSLYFEYSIPRMGKRIDVVILIGPAIFVLEFKVGEKEFLSHAIDQVWDYALDLKNFHESSHDPLIAPILIATIEFRIKNGTNSGILGVCDLKEPHSN